MKQRLIKIDGKTRTDPKFPTGFMDVVQIEKTGENFRIIYDVKGRFTVHRITASEAAYKLCRVRAVSTGPKGVPYLHTSDGRTIRYPDPNAKLNAVVHLGVGVGVPDGAAVAGVQVRHSLGSSGDSPHPAELVGSLRGSDPVDGEASLDVIDDPEVLSSLLNLDDVHEPSGELGVSPGLAIDLDQTLLH